MINIKFFDEGRELAKECVRILDANHKELAFKNLKVGERALQIELPCGKDKVCIFLEQVDASGIYRFIYRLMANMDMTFYSDVFRIV